MGNVERKGIGMADDRRAFIKKFGITLGSLIVSGSLPGCGPKKEREVSGAESRIKRQSNPSSTPCGPAWEALRQCWLDLKTLDEDMDLVARQNIDQFLKGTMTGEKWIALEEMTPKKRVAAHQASLDALMARDQVEEPVARHMQMAFEEATYHLVRSRATCYFALPLEHAPRKDFLQQVDVLSRISADLDPATVAKAQAAIAQDMAFFENFETYTMFKTFNPDNYGPAREDFKAGNLKASPEALEAARLLTQLFLERPN